MHQPSSSLRGQRASELLRHLCFLARCEQEHKQTLLISDAVVTNVLGLDPINKHDETTRNTTVTRHCTDRSPEELGRYTYHFQVVLLLLCYIQWISPSTLIVRERKACTPPPFSSLDRSLSLNLHHHHPPTRPFQVGYRGPKQASLKPV